MIRISLIFLYSLPLLVFSQTTWQSSIVNFNSSNKLNYVSDANQNRVIDFSYAGYKNSNVALPTIVNIIATIIPTIGDRTADINNAIQAAAVVTPDINGFRGVIQLLAGNYEIQGTILLNVSGVVLRGAGSDINGTVFTATGDVPHQRNVLLAGGGTNVAWVKSGSKINITTPFVQVGSMSFDVTSAAGFSVGDAIIVYHPSSSAWIAAVDNGGVATAAPWTAGSIDIQMNKTIAAINGNTITVESPITNHLNLSLSQSYIYKVNKATTKSLIGIENLRIDIQNWTNETVDENHAWEAIEMNDIEDSWVKNVVALHFGQSGFRTGTATRITFDGCQALVPVATLTGSQRDNFQAFTYSSNILFTKCFATKARHAFEVSGTSSATSIVFTRCKSEDATNPSEGHFHWPTAILYDCFRDSGTQTDVVLGVYDRGSYGTNHGWAAAHSVVWNCDLRRPTTPYGIVICQQPPTAQNFVIGGFGQVNLASAIPFPQYPLGYVEGFNNNTANLIPVSLFDQQLAERLNNQLPVELIDFNGAAKSNTILLSWKTANETDNNFFYIEHSVNGLDFNTIGKEKGSGSTSILSTYNFEDVNPSNDLNYYRLRQVDKDAKTSFTKIIMVKFSNSSFTVVNTLVHDYVTIKANENVETPIMFFNENGQKVFSGIVKGQQQFNISKLSSGVYFIKTSTDKEGRFVKQ